MTAPVDRLAATLAKHRAQYDDYFFICDCGENWPALAECLDEEVAAHERHVAAVIARADDLAVVDLNAGDKYADGDTEWSFAQVHSEGYVNLHGDVITFDLAEENTACHEGVPTVAEGTVPTDLAVQFAAALLAAAKAAEGVSDRG